MQIIERENKIIRHMKKTKSRGGKIYCLGAAILGKTVKKTAALYGIKIDAFVISKKYFVEDYFVDGIPVLCLEEASKKNIFSPNDLMIVGFGNCDNGIINRYRNELTICNEDPFSLWSVDAADGGGILDYNYISAHMEEFASLYRELADNTSRVCMEAFLNQKISGKYLYLDKVYDDGAYYDDRIVDFNVIESFVDCGAFDGDSYLAFRKAYQMNTGKKYGGSAYLLEPDADNYQKMVINCSRAGKDNRFLQYGAWNKRDKLFFHIGDGDSGKIAESGTASIDVNSIDNIVEGQKVDFIKMDIEGSELNALKGARETIATHKPVLAVCVYHKKEDLLTIPAYIRSICPEYKFYIRAYSYQARELVLYAVC